MPSVFNHHLATDFRFAPNFEDSVPPLAFEQHPAFTSSTLDTNDPPSPPLHHSQLPAPAYVQSEVSTYNQAEAQEHPVSPLYDFPKKGDAPMIPATKGAAPNATRIAGQCLDLGPHVQKRFVCEIEGCGKDFRRRYNLKVHMRKHTGETPYFCQFPGCAKKYLWRSSMAHHLKIHEQRVVSSCSSSDQGSEVGPRRVISKTRPYKTSTPNQKQEPVPFDPMPSSWGAHTTAPNPVNNAVQSPTSLSYTSPEAGTDPQNQESAETQFMEMMKINDHDPFSLA